MNELEKMAVDLFTEKYGTEVFSRFEKLKEEVNELFEAFELYKTTNKPFSYHAVKDEISDVQSVLTHIQSLFDMDFNNSLLKAIVKTKVREVYPEYKR